MPIDPSKFHLTNVVDTCAVWNVLSSRRLYSVARQACCSFCCTWFIRYECLDKPRSRMSPAEEDLRDRLRQAIDRHEIIVCPLEVDDLLEVEALEQRKRLGKGELSVMVLAKKLGQGVLTDDQKARRLAETALNGIPVQTTPHLLGWLIFTGRLTDVDKDEIIAEHRAVKRPLTEYFEEAYREALRCRQMESSRKWLE